MPEDHELSEGVYFAYDNEIMLPISETEFGVDKEATYGDLAYALYVIGFGELPADPAEARDALAQYRIMNSGISTDEKLTAATTERCLLAFSLAVGVSYAKDDAAGDTVLTWGQLAQKLLDYLKPFM